MQKYETFFVWLLTDCKGQKAAVVATDSDAARELASAHAPQWRFATSEKISVANKLIRLPMVLALERHLDEM